MIRPIDTNAICEPWVEVVFGEQEHFQEMIKTANRAAADNRRKALHEAKRGAFHFAEAHEIASIEYEEDVQAMMIDNKPIHHSMKHYVEIRSLYERLDARSTPRTPNGTYADAA